MNFKEFFKPTKGKILLFIIIFLIIPAPIFKVQIFGGPNECSGIRTCVTGYTTLWFSLGGLIFLCNLSGGCPFLEDMTFVHEILRVLYLAITPYILSCLIIFLYKKLKTKK